MSWGGLFLDDITVTGETQLLGAQVTGDVDCSRAIFANREGHAFIAQRLTVTGRLFWQDMGAPPDGTVDFTHARVGYFLDDEQSWPQAGKLRLDGFVYDNITTNTSAAQRIRWLAHILDELNFHEPVFWPQPYEQVIKVFKASGHEREARLVAMEKQDVYRRHLKKQSRFVIELRHAPELSKFIQFLTAKLEDMAKDHEYRAELEGRLKGLEHIQGLKTKYADHPFT